MELICEKPPPHAQLRAPLCLPDNFSPTNTFVLIYPYRCATRLPYCHSWQGKLLSCPLARHRHRLGKHSSGSIFPGAGLPHRSASHPGTALPSLETTGLRRGSFDHQPLLPPPGVPSSTLLPASDCPSSTGTPRRTLPGGAAPAPGGTLRSGHRRKGRKEPPPGPGRAAPRPPRPLT